MYPERERERENKLVTYPTKEEKTFAAHHRRKPQKPTKLHNKPVCCSGENIKSYNNPQILLSDITNNENDRKGLYMLKHTPENERNCGLENK